MKKKDYFLLSIIIITILLIIIITKGFNNIYGSKTDWISQHWALPEYFRTLFYQTKNPFPNFAPNLGGGQNIYHFSYYGLLNPLLFPSYFLPFIKMVDYIIVSSLMVVLISAFLFYKWLINNEFNTKTSFLSTFIFILANFFIFHTHRHLMFVNYLPFIILGLMGIDKYFKSNKRWLLILSVFLLIMTSYFYSVGGLITLFLYALYKLLDDDSNFKSFSFGLLKIVGLMLVGILMAGILLLPTTAIIVNGRGQAVNDIEFITLLKPKIEDIVLLYSTYSLGFPLIGLVGLLYGFFSKKKKLIVLSFCLSFFFFFPFVIYILNGFLYVRHKVLIPFAPLVGLLIAHFLKGVWKKEISLIPLLLVAFLIGIINFTNFDKSLAYFLDLLILFGTLFSYYHFKKKVLLIIPIMAVSFISSLKANYTENYVSKAQYENDFNESKQKIIEEVIKKDHSYYRFNNLDNTLSTVNKIYHPRYFQTSLYSSTYNNKYNDFYYDEFKNAIPYRNRVITAQSGNLLFQTLMGVKYVGTSKEPPLGYKLLKGESNFKIYKNDNVFSLGYVTNKIMSLNDYLKLDYPYNLEPLLKGVVVEGEESNYQFQNTIQKINLDYTKEIGPNILVKKENDNYYLDVSKKDKINLKVTNLEKDQILMIKFDLLNNPSCKEGDIAISINGVKNVLTCREWIYHNRNYSFEYLLSSNDIIDNLKIEFTKGHYEIAKLETNVLNYKEIKDLSKELSQMKVNMDKTKGNYIYGNVEVINDGYFVTTLPYDKGFKVKVNGNPVSIKEVNHSFVGFPLKKGVYEIVIEYESPLFKEGLIMSCVGFISYLGIVVLDHKKKKTN